MKRSFVVSAVLLVSACAAVPDNVTPESTAEVAQAIVAPCTDPRGCPDLVISAPWLRLGMVLDSRHISPDECKVQEGETQPGNRRLLRFSYAAINLGQGELFLGDPNDHPDWYEFNTCHGHLHLKEAAEYRLWQPDDYAQWLSIRAASPGVTADDLFAAYPRLRAQMVQNLKPGVCLVDVVPCSPELGCPAGQEIDPPAHSAYTDSCHTDQGLSVGWMDVYAPWQDGQWVDVPPTGGTFVLEVESNAQLFFQESDYTNNTAAVCVNIPPVNHRDREHWRPDPNCITPPELVQASDCEICRVLCNDLGTPDPAECSCVPFACGGVPWIP